MGRVHKHLVLTDEGCRVEACESFDWMIYTTTCWFPMICAGDLENSFE
jgi:hypothetical protein